jgi:ribonuclease HII
MRKFDSSFLNENVKLIAGADEVGRGPLAGPVVASAVIFPPDVYIRGVKDSKQLSEMEREKLLPKILAKCLACSVSAITHTKIDEINILQASLLAMKNSINKLSIKPDLILVDGNQIFYHHTKVIPIIKGDSKSFSIAAASIVAKVARDRVMKRLSVRYPKYLWEKNKGYATKEHIAAIKQYGPSVLHRKTFLKKILEPDFSNTREELFESSYEELFDIKER